ncbi:hypothetical protein QYF61_013363 [Mycteria americana]|uniref:Endonuclease/exonuclease/phosphatase domain-containing protein n=1 Tax=Mycteria americana TaxID=33587 RepID=A0AAN7N928_MYCAM|nr:hypothetical protein QYF61_013363 [Mycteria americana]
MASPEGGNASGNIYAAPGSTEGSGAHLKCLCTNARNMRNKPDEMEVLVSSQSYDVIGISETWWNESHDRSAGMEGYRLFRRNRQGRRGGGVAPYVRDRCDCTALTVRDDVVESLWVRIKGMENKGDVTVGVYYRSPSQDVSTDELFCRQLGEISGLVALVLMGDFNFPGIDWEYHTAVTSRSWKSLKFVEDDNFLSQVLSEPTRKGAFLDLLFVNREGLVGDVMQAGQKTSLAKQGTPCGAQEEKAIVSSLEVRSGFAGRVQSHALHLQGEDVKGQSSTRVESGQCCFRHQEMLFLSMLIATGG